TLTDAQELANVASYIEKLCIPLDHGHYDSKPGDSEDPNWKPPADTAKRVAEGKALYEKECLECHGKDGEGILGPTLKLNADKKAWLHTDGSLRSIVALIKSGLEPSVTESGITMPARGGARLTDEQVEQVAAYVMHLHRTAPASP
ncbi:MAG: hypothetical protein CVV20_00240, partial [Gemmatimonadetes bacterium HGW-Gemmatimonadetes-1]